jgi:hypothetical protein
MHSIILDEITRQALLDVADAAQNDLDSTDMSDALEEEAMLREQIALVRALAGWVEPDYSEDSQSENNDECRRSDCLNRPHALHKPHRYKPLLESKRS